jgi:hypothetical protein
VNGSEVNGLEAAVGRVREFQSVVSYSAESVAVKVGNREVEARGSGVSRSALLESAVVKFKSWSQLIGGCPWWLGGCSELSRCYPYQYCRLVVHERAAYRRKRRRVGLGRTACLLLNTAL